MHRVFQRFIDHLSTAYDVSTFSEVMTDVAAGLDLCSFAYLALPSQRSRAPLIISTYPEIWVAHYVRNHYERLDPIIVQALQTPEPFQWGLGLSTELTRAQQDFFDEACHFGIRFGFTVPIHDGHGPIAALTFACDQRNTPFETRVRSNARVLQLMALNFHAHARRKLRSEHCIDGICLSTREFECLEWASEGKSAWEISRILGLSHHTVASYLKSAKKKLGVRTVVQAATRLVGCKKRKPK
jgi:DNA-binding CsgD family transcriptional regulator